MLLCEVFVVLVKCYTLEQKSSFPQEKPPGLK